MEQALQKRKPSRAVKKISVRQALKFAEESGYTLIKIKASHAAASLGIYIEQEILKTLAPTVLLSTMEDLKLAIANCHALLALPNDEITVDEKDKILNKQINLIREQIALAKALQEAAVLIGKTAPTPKVLNPSFGPREQVRPVNVNIGIQSSGDISVDGKAS